MKNRLGAGKSRRPGSGRNWEAWRKALRKRFPENFEPLERLRKIDPLDASRYLVWAGRTILVLGLFLAAGVTARLIGLLIQPAPIPPALRSAAPVAKPSPKEDYDAILRRNKFNVEGTIPDPFDQGQLDCFSQARPSSQPLQILGTIVMNDERFSVALVQEEGNPEKTAVRKDERFFNGKYTALKVERHKLCFQVQSTQELEFIEIPLSGGELGVSGPSLQSAAPTEGVTPVSENEYVVNQAFLEKNLLNLNDILQTALAMPYTDPATGKFNGYLIQSISPESPFTKLGVKQGDVLTGVNDIVFDNMGKGLEAFQRLRNSPKISLKVMRGGQQQNLTYDIKQ